MASDAWAVRAAIICNLVERGDNGSVIELHGVDSLRLVEVDVPPFLVTGVLYVSMVALRDAEPFTVTVTIMPPGGLALGTNAKGYPAIARHRTVETVSELTLGLPSLGLYWIAVSVDGEELTRVPLLLALLVAPSAGTVH